MALADNNLSWGLQQTYGTREQGYGGNATVNYRGTYGEMTSGYGYDKNTRRLNYGLSGSLVAHANGITLGQPLGETAVLVAAPGAAGARVTNQTGVRTDWRGYALVPYLSAYRRSEVALSPETLPDEVDLPQSSQRVTPTRGALVRADFRPRVGARALITLLRTNGQPVPFGATVSDAEPNATQGSIVGDGGQVYLSGLSPQGRLQVKWGNGSAEQCRVDYRLPSAPQPGGVVQTNGVCQ